MIEEGILDLLSRPSAEVIGEQQENIKALRKNRLSKNDEWLLALPLADDFGNAKYRIVNRGYLANFQMVINLMGALRSKSVLDLGAGTCWTTNILAEKGAVCVAVDISREKYIGLSSADTFFKYRRTYFERVLSDMNGLPFKGRSFDVVLSNASVHHAQYLEGVFQESSRVLKDNGLLVLVNEPCSSVFKLSKRLDIAKAKERGMDVSEGWNEMIYSLFQYKSAARRSGLKLKVFYPALYDLILRQRRNLDSIHGVKHYLAITCFYLYQIDALRKLSRSLFLLYLALLGGVLVAIAQKTPNHAL